MKKFDYCVIGAGIIGTSIALEMSKRGIGNILVLEKECSPGMHTSGRNSGVIHSGINQMPGSMKARFCVEGNKMLRKYCKDNGVRMNECGTVVVARNKREERVLYTLFGLGTYNGVENLRIADKYELKDIEPEAEGMRALISPSGAVVDSEGLVKAIELDCKKRGVEFKYSSKVRSIDAGNRILTDTEYFDAKYIVNASGLYADKIAQMKGIGKGLRVIPFRGEYFQINGLKINSMVYQAPNLDFPFLGVHFTRTIDGKVIAGPSAVLSLGRESYDKQVNLAETGEMVISPNFWRMCLKPEFIKLASHNIMLSLSKGRFLEEISGITKRRITEEMISPGRAGIRPQLVDSKGKMLDDLLIERTDDSMHILNSVSPGMTCSLAFAKYVVDEILKNRR